MGNARWQNDVPRQTFLWHRGDVRRARRNRADALGKILQVGGGRCDHAVLDTAVLGLFLRRRTADEFSERHRDDLSRDRRHHAYGFGLLYRDAFHQKDLEERDQGGGTLHRPNAAEARYSLTI